MAFALYNWIGQIISEPIPTKMPRSKYRNIDEYGFDRPENFDYKTYDAFMSHYLRTLTRRELRWNSVYQNRNFKKNNTLKRFIRKGIPANFRKACWMAVSGAQQCRENCPATYPQLKRGVESSAISETIKIDLPRTFPDNIFFLKDKNFCSMLYNVLVTFADQNREVGYCQGLNYIAGLILLAIKDEATTFWLLKTLVEQILPKYYIVTMSGLLADLDVINEVIEEYEPTVQRHINKIGMPWAMIATKWFICAYADVLPAETVLRIWDCLFYEGSKIIMRVALALIKLHKLQILETNDLSELMDVFRNMRNHPGVVDCHGFMHYVFDLSGSLSGRKINKLRLKYTEE